MALSYHPNQGSVLACDYTTGFKPPEMVKLRPVIVITPRLRKRSDLCTVVPLSLTQPESIEAYHCPLELPVSLPKPWDSNKCWVKADMFSTVCYDRLSPIRLGRDGTGKRIYYTSLVPRQDIKLIQAAVLAALNLKHLTEYL